MSAPGKRLATTMQSEKRAQRGRKANRVFLEIIREYTPFETYPAASPIGGGFIAFLKQSRLARIGWKFKERNMKHVMVDLETLGTVPGCAILSVGAVYFDATGLGDEFYMVARQDSCLQAGLTIDAGTADWWSKQSPEARKVVAASLKKGQHSIKHVLEKFTEFINLDTDVKVWGNGADFDNPILACAFAAVELEHAWAAWNGRCYRTLKNIVPGPKLVRVGTHHNALDDAKSQALHAIELFKLHPSLVWK